MYCTATTRCQQPARCKGSARARRARGAAVLLAAARHTLPREAPQQCLRRQQWDSRLAQETVVAPTPRVETTPLLASFLQAVQKMLSTPEAGSELNILRHLTFRS